jgi:hypothetical protein
VTYSRNSYKECTRTCLHIFIFNILHHFSSPLCTRHVFLKKNTARIYFWSKYCTHIANCRNNNKYLLLTMKSRVIANSSRKYSNITQLNCCTLFTSSIHPIASPLVPIIIPPLPSVIAITESRSYPLFTSHCYRGRHHLLRYILYCAYIIYVW